eukprot:g14938.t1
MMIRDSMTKHYCGKLKDVPKVSLLNDVSALRRRSQNVRDPDATLLIRLLGGLIALAAHILPFTSDTMAAQAISKFITANSLVATGVVSFTAFSQVVPVAAGGGKENEKKDSFQKQITDELRGLSLAELQLRARFLALTILREEARLSGYTYREDLPSAVLSNTILTLGDMPMDFVVQIVAAWGQLRETDVASVLKDPLQWEWILQQMQVNPKWKVPKHERHKSIRVTALWLANERNGKKIAQLMNMLPGIQELEQKFVNNMLASRRGAAGNNLAIGNGTAEAGAANGNNTTQTSSLGHRPAFGVSANAGPIPSMQGSSSPVFEMPSTTGTLMSGANQDYCTPGGASSWQVSPNLQPSTQENAQVIAKAAAKAAATAAIVMTDGPLQDDPNITPPGDVVMGGTTEDEDNKEVEAKPKAKAKSNAKAKGKPVAQEKPPAKGKAKASAKEEATPKAKGKAPCSPKAEPKAKAKAKGQASGPPMKKARH